ncbi:MAG: trypsin-like serine protease [Bdellovibrionales bacterium]|nr:trypsin-like serine protease [Bdellovibrionales bacterium]
MIRFVLFFLFISFFNLSRSFTKNKLINFQPKVIYDKDNRKDFYEIKDKKIRDLSLATVALFDSSSLKAANDAETLFKINAYTLKDSYNLCSSEKYLHQPAAAFCTGFLIAPDLIISAGHCALDQSDCENIHFVFDYKFSTKTQKQIQIPKSSIYFCKELMSQSDDTFLDHSIIKLDRPVTDRKPLKIRTKGLIQKNTKIFVMGYPSGIPLKITKGGARVSKVSETSFLANLDTFQGNSGSAVLNSKTYEVEGILVRGETDYKYNLENSCNLTNVCLKKDNCSGEGIVKITSIKKEIDNALNSKKSDNLIRNDDNCENDIYCEADDGENYFL